MCIRECVCGATPNALTFTHTHARACTRAAWGVADPASPKRALQSPPHLFELGERFTEYDQAAFSPFHLLASTSGGLLQERYLPLLQRMLSRPDYWWLPTTDGAESLDGAVRMAAAKAMIVASYPGGDPPLSPLTPFPHGTEPGALPAPAPPWYAPTYEPQVFAFAALSTTSVVRSVLRSVLTDGFALITGLREAGNHESVWRLADKIIAPETKRNLSFWDARGMSHDAHYNRYHTPITTGSAKSDTQRPLQIRQPQQHRDGRGLPRFLWIRVPFSSH